MGHCAHCVIVWCSVVGLQSRHRSIVKMKNSIFIKAEVSFSCMSHRKTPFHFCFRLCIKKKSIPFSFCKFPLPYLYSIFISIFLPEKRKLPYIRPRPPKSSQWLWRRGSRDGSSQTTSTLPPNSPLVINPSSSVARRVTDRDTHTKIQRTVSSVNTPPVSPFIIPRNRVPSTNERTYVILPCIRLPFPFRVRTCTCGISTYQVRMFILLLVIRFVRSGHRVSQRIDRS